MSKNNLIENNNNIIIYTTDDGQVEIEVRLEDENVWLTQNSMAELFDTTRNNITMHIKNIFEEGELQEKSVSKESLLTAKDGKNYKTKFYNLDLIIAVGYRVKSVRGTQFRIWANKLIKKYLIKGYNLNVKRFKNNGGGTYFEEVLEKIRDIRSSEKVFWRKILDIYATSVDYDAKNKQTREFFKTVQNKMHYAVHGNTAAEVIFNRVDSEKKSIGLTNIGTIGVAIGFVIMMILDVALVWDKGKIDRKVVRKMCKSMRKVIRKMWKNNLQIEVKASTNILS